MRKASQEHRKSFLDAEGKELCRQREEELLARVDGVFTEKELQPPNGYLAVLQAACKADELDLDAAEVERLWRAASGAAHGMYWPNLELQTLNVGEEYEPGHFRARSFPDTAIMLDAMQAAHKMCTYAAMKYVLYAGADPTPLMQSAKRWLMDNVTLRPDVDPEALRALLGDDPPDATA